MALTFDDGPEGDNKTGKVLDILKACNERHAGSYGPIRATFFVNGAKVKQHPELVRRIVAEGHVLGNHTWNHPHLPTLDKKAVQSQLETAQVAVERWGTTIP